MAVRATYRSAVAIGGALNFVGAGVVAAGIVARRQIAATLAQERITCTPDAATPNAPVVTARTTLAMADIIRDHALAATGGRTYAEIEPFLDEDGNPTADIANARRDPITGRPVENPVRALTLAATTLRTALVQAHMAFRVADFTVAVGGLFALAGIGIALAGRVK